MGSSGSRRMLSFEPQMGRSQNSFAMPEAVVDVEVRLICFWVDNDQDFVIRLCQ